MCCWGISLGDGALTSGARARAAVACHELVGVRDFNIFVVQIYLKAWYRCQCPVLAPLNDLELLKQFAAYKRQIRVWPRQR